MGLLPTEVLIFVLLVWMYVKLKQLLCVTRYVAYGKFASIYENIGVTVPLPLSKEVFEQYKVAKKKDEKRSQSPGPKKKSSKVSYQVYY